MSIIPQLASSLGRRDEIPNQELATQIVIDKDRNAIQELVESLKHKSMAIQNDCIKVLYEIAVIDPSLILVHATAFIELLEHKNNRLQWGAMTALSAITLENPKLIHASLARIIEVADKGSVITKDHAVNILIDLCSLKEYANDAFLLLIAQLLTSPTNQLPMYAERAMPIVDEKNKTLFIKTLSDRLDDIEKDTKRARVEKVIKKLNK